MKKIAILHLICALLLSTLYAQVSIPATVSEKLRVYSPGNQYVRLEPGTPVRIDGYSLQPVVSSNEVNWRLFAEGDENMYLVSPNDADELAFDYDNLSMEQIWELSFLRSEALKEAGKHGWDYDIRQDLDQEYAEMEEQFSYLTDPYLHDYLNRLLLRIFPGSLPDVYPANLHVRIIQAPTPHAFAAANGAIFISTGMLTVLGAEEELVAILAQEVAHIVLDHSVSNFRMMEQRQARAQFWAGLLTVAAAVGETTAVAGAYKNGYDPYLYYDVGGFTESVALLAYSVAHEISSRVGMEYTSEQVQESTGLARLVLDKLGYPDKALFNALFRIREFYVSTRNSEAMRLDTRLLNYGKLAREMGIVHELPPIQLEYTRHTSLANLIIASQEFALGRYQRARELPQRNIDAGVAVAEDYILMSAIQRRTTDGEEGMNRAMGYLEQAGLYARSLPNEFFVEKALVHLRLGQRAEARTALETYQEQEPYLPASSEQESALQWWVRNMLEKVERM